MFFLRSLVMVALFLIGAQCSYFIWALPCYRIKKMRDLDLKRKIVINLITITILVALFNSKETFFFIGIYILIEFLYEILNRRFYKIGTFDKVFILTLIVGSIAAVTIYLNYEAISNTYLNMITETLNKLKADGATEESLTFIYTVKDFLVENKEFLKNYCIYGAMLVFAVNSFIIYYILNRKSFKYWRVSYIWLVPYIILFFTTRYFIKDSMILENILEALKLIYIMYFCKIVYRLINSTLKKDGLSLIISLIVTLNMPWLAFAIGGIASGIDIRVRVIRK